MFGLAMLWVVMVEADQVEGVWPDDINDEMVIVSEHLLIE